MARIVSATTLAFAVAASIPSAHATTFSLSSGFSGRNAVGQAGTDYFSHAPVSQKKTVTDASGTHYASLDAVLNTSADGSFLFENSLVGTGTSGGRAATSLFVSITNDSAQAQSLQLDSQITPGHIAARDAGGASPGSNAFFNFSILEDTGCSDCALPSLYGMSATIRPVGLGFSASRNFYDLNGLQRTRVGNELAYDWSATNIGIDLGQFLAGQTRTFIYQLDTSSSIYASQGGLANVCTAAQVSFGDPKSRGTSGGSASAALALARPFDQAPTTDANKCDIGRVNPLIGLPFGPFGGSISIVPSGTPVTQPTPDGPVNYNPVPEPAAFALFGIGALALATRRRRG